eukprot:TRINITY_DN6548_c0_g1_i1.p1 TRINITY_DN6548_c0_g1~~TRINITY_DN6548_c0_g1_i1.p1  ORF type:complete len:509 (-),score=72.68 TRINITY_DN6548_c0_g1_i1:8-1324(-)
MYPRMWQVGLRHANVCTNITINGPVTPSLLKSALRRIQLKHPIWNWGIHLLGSKFYYHEFDDSDKKIVFNVFKTIKKEDVHNFIESRLNDVPPMDPSQLLWTADLISHSEEEHTLLIWQFHGITDGAALMLLVKEVLTELDNENRSEPLPQRAQPSLPVGIAELTHSLPSWKRIAAWKKMLPRALYGVIELEHMKGSLKTPVETPALPRTRKSHYLTSKLSPQQLESLKLRCKEHGVSISAATIAACALAIKSCGLPSEGVYRLHTPINIRERVVPKVKNDQFMVAIVATDVDIPLSENLDFWAVAKHVHSTYLTPSAIEREIAEGELFLEGIDALIETFGPKIAAKMLQNPEERGVMSVSCFGAFGGSEFPSQVGKFTMEHVEITAPPGSTGSFPMCMSFTYQGTFYISWTYYEPIMSNERAASAFKIVTDLLSGAK